MEPLIRTHKIGSEITATVSITGTQREIANITFSCPEGLLGVIKLEPVKPKLNNLKFETFMHRKLNIISTRMNFPAILITGNIELRAEYSNRNGNNFKPFNGLIATWSLEGLI